MTPLYFPEYVKELELYYDVEKEIIAWKSLDELASSIRYFAKHPREAEAIRAAGHRRALASHQWTHRFQALFQVLSIPQKLSRTRSSNVAAAGQ